MRRLKTLAGLIAAAIALLAPANAQVNGGMQYVPLGYCQLTTVSASIGPASCSGGVPVGATRIVVTIEAQAVRYRDDGTAPTSTVGMPLAVGATITYTGTLTKIAFIESTGGAILNISFYR